jgi:oxidoreductase
MEKDTHTEGNMQALRAIVVGGTGAIGKELIKELSENENFAKVTTLVRRKPETEQNDKVESVVVDFENLDEYKDAFKDKDVAFCCLGTTRKDAGSDAAFKKVDYTYVTNFAQLAKDNGVNDFHLVSSVGASKNSWFLYPRTKGESEDYITKLNFATLTIYRPGLLDRGDSARKVEKFASYFMKTMPVNTHAKAMIIRALQPNKERSAIWTNKEIFKSVKRIAEQHKL